MDVINNLLDDIGLCYGSDDAQPTTALGTHFYVNLENTLQSFCLGKRGQGTIGFSIGIDSDLRFSMSRVLTFSPYPFIGRGRACGTWRWVPEHHNTG